MTQKHNCALLKSEKFKCCDVLFHKVSIDLQEKKDSFIKEKKYNQKIVCSNL